MPGETSQIPVGTQFTPNLVDLPLFLRALVAHSGDKARMMREIWARPINLRSDPKLPGSERQRSLPLEAAIQYELLTPDYEATDLCKALSVMSSKELDDEFARHILLNLGGLRVVEAAQQMRLDGHSVTADALAGYLTDQGFVVGIHNTAINSLRMWLAKAGVFPSGRSRAWDVDEAEKQRLVGFDDETIAALVGLTEHQRAFAVALCRIDPTGEYPAADVRELAEMMVGERLDRGNLPKLFLEPLRRAGLIEYTTGGTSSGKTSKLMTTTKFDSQVLTPFLERAVDSLDAALTAYYRKPLEDVYVELDSKETHVKGEALEAFAIHVMRLLGLRFVAWRKRAKQETGQAEVDVVLSGLIGGIPTRWQIQCKNKPSGLVRLEDVAKEVGLVPLTHATHILIIANGRATVDAHTFAREVMRHSSLTVFIIDHDDFEAIRKSPASIASILKSKSRSAEQIERHGLDWLR